MISKTIGFRGTLFSDKPTCQVDTSNAHAEENAEHLGERKRRMEIWGRNIFRPPYVACEWIMDPHGSSII